MMGNFDDLNKVGEMVKKEIGFVPRFIRFPGGASNTVSRKYCPGIMSTLVKEVKARGYQYYDWNADSTDASGNHVAVSKLVANGTSSRANNINLLCHDTDAKSTTVEALPAIITHYQQLGYQFKGIDEDSFNVNHDFVEIGDKPCYESAAHLAQSLMELYESKKVDKVELLYYHFKSMAKQIYTRETFLPFAVSDLLSGDDGVPVSSDYILEPSADDIICEMLPKVMKLKIFTVLLDSCASEHGARTLAMQTATDNANDLLQELNVMYNKSRQQSITNEILDIVAGSMR